MYSNPSSRGEKLSTLKLTVVQYGILFMMLALAAGLWRLQVLGAENFRQLAEQNRIRKVPVLAARESSLTAKAACWWTITLQSPAFWSASRTATWTPICRRLRAGCISTLRSARHAAPLSRHTRLPAHPHQAGGHPRRAGLHRSAPQRIAGVGDH